MFYQIFEKLVIFYLFLRFHSAFFRILIYWKNYVREKISLRWVWSWNSFKSIGHVSSLVTYQNSISFSLILYLIWYQSATRVKIEGFFFYIFFDDLKRHVPKLSSYRSKRFRLQVLLYFFNFFLFIIFPSWEIIILTNLRNYLFLFLNYKILLVLLIHF